MKILIYGVGGIGGFIGCRLYKSNSDVFFFTKNSKIQKLKKNGLVLKTNKEEIICKNINVIDSLKDTINFDIIFLSVKLYDLESSLKNIFDHIDENTIILPFQNGIIAEKLIENKLGKNRVFGAVAQISCFKNESDEIIHNGKLATFFVGSLSKKNLLIKKLEKFVQKQNMLGLDIRYTQNIEEKIWDKFIFLSAYSGLTTLYCKSIGEIFEDSNLRDMFINAMQETYNLSLKIGVVYRNNPIENWLKKIPNMPYDMTSSMYLDFRKRKRLELNWLSGSIVKLGNQYLISMSTHQKILDGIKSNLN